MKKIIKIIAIVFVLGFGYVGLKVFNFGKIEDLTNYISEDVKFVAITNHANEDFMKINKKIIDKLLLNDKISLELRKEIEKNYKSNEKLALILNKVMIIGQIDIVGLTEMEPQKMIENIKIFIQTKLSETVLLKAMKNIQEDNLEIIPIDKKIFNLIITYKNEITKEKKSINLVAKIDGGNVIIGKTAKEIEEIIKTKGKHKETIFVKKIKENNDEDKLIILGGKDKTDILTFVDIELKNNEFKINIEATGKEFEAFGKEFFSHNGEDGLYGKRKLEQNKLYLRTTGNVGLLSFIPAIKINEKDSFSGIETEISKDQFLYLDFNINNDIYTKLAGYYQNGKLTYKMNLKEEVILNLLDEEKLEKALEEIENILY